MGTEVEAKFIVPDQAAADQVRDLVRLGRYSLGTGRLVRVLDDYLDTSTRALLSAGYACRRREEDGQVALGLKTVERSPAGEGAARAAQGTAPAGPGAAPADARAAPDAIHRREELEATPERLQELAGGEPLQVLFSLSQQRYVREVADGGRTVALASLDDVSLVAGSDSQRWHELEIELTPGGTEHDLAVLSGWVRDALGFHAAESSKFERALQVMSAAPRRGARAARAGRRAAKIVSVVLDGPVDGPAKLPAESLAGMGYSIRTQRRAEDQVVFYDTHDAAYLKKGYTLTWSRSSRTWRLREDGRVEAQEAGPREIVPLDGPIGAALGGIPADHPTIPLLEASLEQVDYGISGVGSESLRLRARKWTFRSPLLPVEPKTLLRLTVSGPASSVAYFCGLLQDRLGFQRTRATLLEQGMSLLGISAPGAAIPGELRVGSDDSVESACRKVFRGEAWRMRMNASGAIRDLHPEFVHTLRVATRRARSAARLFSSLLGPEDLPGLRDELRWLAGLLGAVRDLDVLGSRLDVQLALAGAPAGFSATLRRSIADRRARALQELVPALQSSRFDAFVGRLESMGTARHAAMSDARVSDAAMSDATVSADWFARKRIAKLLRRLSPWADRPAEGLSDAELHRIRILFKRLRYACEFFRHLLGRGADELIRSFVSFQDCLGLHQDAATAIRLLTESLGELPAVQRTEEVLLSMGALLQVQRDVQQAQKRAFARKWVSVADLLALGKRLRAAGGNPAGPPEGGAA